MTLAYIYATFQGLASVTDKIAYLRELERLNLPYDLNYSSLIAAWEAQA
jgi:hypothetical protein